MRVSISLDLDQAQNGIIQGFFLQFWEGPFRLGKLAR